MPQYLHLKGLKSNNIHISLITLRLLTKKHILMSLTQSTVFVYGGIIHNLKFPTSHGTLQMHLPVSEMATLVV